MQSATGVSDVQKRSEGSSVTEMTFPSSSVLSSDAIACLPCAGTGMQTCPYFNDRPFKEFLQTFAESTFPYGTNNFLSSRSVVFKLILDILIFIKIY